MVGLDGDAVSLQRHHSACQVLEISLHNLHHVSWLEGRGCRIPRPRTPHWREREGEGEGEKEGGEGETEREGERREERVWERRVCEREKEDQCRRVRE